MSTLGPGRLAKGILKLAPQSWRDAIARDLEDDARASGRGAWWCAWHAARIALTLRASVIGDATMNDLRYAFRSLLRARWFTVSAVLTFAIGIGVNVAVFSMVDRLLFRALPYQRPQELVLIVPTEAGKLYSRTPKQIVVRARHISSTFADLAVAGQTRGYAFDAASPDAPPVKLTEATHNLLAVLGVRPALGRDFTREDALARARMALISYDAWQQRYDGNADVVGRRLGRSGAECEIIGVLPAGFLAPGGLALSDGLVLDPDLLETATSRDAVAPAVGRLRHGVSIAAAQATAETVAAQLSVQLGRPGDQPLHVAVLPLQEGLFQGYRAYLWLVVLAAAMVLLIACANLSSLFLARGQSREQTVALASALGASAVRLMAVACLECLTVAMTGAGVALLAVAAAWRGLLALEPGVLQRYAVGVADGRVLLIAVATGVAAALLAAILPALRVRRVDIQAVLQQGARAGGRTRPWPARSLLAVQAAFGILLVSGAILTGRSLLGLLTRDLGFVPRDLVVVSAQPPFEDPSASKLAMYAEVRDMLRQQPGVESVGGIDTFSIGQNTFMRAFPSPTRIADGGLYQVTGGYFETVRTPLLAGRTISDDDTARHAAVIVLSERGARTIWPDVPPGDVIGRSVTVENEPTRVVVGVVADQRPTRLRQPVAGAFVPFDQADPKFGKLATMELVVRTRPGDGVELAALRDRLRTEFPRATVSATAATAELGPSMQQPKFQVLLFSSFAVSALLLAAVGLYAIASFDVARRRYEMGVRLTLGASPGQVHWQMVQASLAPVMAGLVFGLAGTWWAGQFLQSFLDDVRARDPVLIAAAALTLLGAALLASWAPARRAARTDPAVVLRAQ